jgi:hypothetical protein
MNLIGAESTALIPFGNVQFQGPCENSIHIPQWGDCQSHNPEILRGTVNFNASGDNHFDV